MYVYACLSARANQQNGPFAIKIVRYVAGGPEEELIRHLLDAPTRSGTVLRKGSTGKFILSAIHKIGNLDSLEMHLDTLFVLARS